MSASSQPSGVGLSGSLLGRVEDQAVHCELHVHVDETGLRQRVLLLPFGHVQRKASRRVIERSVVADQDESGDGEDLVDRDLFEVLRAHRR